MTLAPGLDQPVLASSDRRVVPARRRGGLLSARGVVGMSMVAAVVLAGLVGPLLVSPGANQQGPLQLLGPSSAHWLGTDELGRDIFSRTLSGIRVDLLMVLVAAPAGAAIGVLVGLVSTTWSTLDIVTQRVFDVVLAFPALILALLVTAIVGPGIVTVGAVIGIAEIPSFGRLIRTSALTVRELPYVESSRVTGSSTWWVLRKHVLPNSLEPLAVQLALSMSLAVFIEGGMSFLGVGITPPTPSLGSLIQDGMKNVFQTAYAPVGALVVVCMLTLGFLMISQALSGGRRD